MSEATTTFTSGFAEFLGPLLRTIRSTGFFEVWVYIPASIVLTICLFILLLKRMRDVDALSTGFRSKAKGLYKFLYLSVCFLLATAPAVALKTMIVEELDYEELPWFLPLVGPLHIYIASVAGAYYWLIVRNKAQFLDLVLSIFVQVGLIGGYLVGVHRILNEPLEFPDITTGASGYINMIWFGLLNIDIFDRMPKTLGLNRPESRTQGYGAGEFRVTR